MKGKLVCLSLLIIVIAYSNNEPLPKGWKQPWKTRLYLGSITLFNNIGKLLSKITVDHFSINRQIADASYSIVSSISPKRPNFDAIQTKDTTISGVPVRIYYPVTPSTEKQPGIVYYHGGGFCIGSIHMYDKIMRRIVNDVGAIAISVGYRLAPEYMYPTPFNDCYDVTKYVLLNAKEFGIDDTRIAVAGDSAGGNLAAGIALKLRDEKLPVQPKLQALMYPILQFVNCQTPSRQYNYNSYVVSRDQSMSFQNGYFYGYTDKFYVLRNKLHIPYNVIKTMNERYLTVDTLPKDELMEGYKDPVAPEESDEWDYLESIVLNPYTSPLLADNLSNLPPAYISVCQNDMLRDDGIWYAQRLGKNAVLDHLYCFHGWMYMSEDLISADEAMAKFTDYFKQRL